MIVERTVLFHIFQYLTMGWRTCISHCARVECVLTEYLMLWNFKKIEAKRSKVDLNRRLCFAGNLMYFFMKRIVLSVAFSHTGFIVCSMIFLQYCCGFLFFKFLHSSIFQDLNKFYILSYHFNWILTYKMLRKVVYLYCLFKP